MKKEVQALINRRRARVIPAILMAIAGLILIGIIVLVVAAASNGPGLGVIRTATPTPSATATITPSPTVPTETNTPAETATITPSPGPSPTATQNIYTVESGDTLFSIASKFKANVCTLMAVNNITNPSVLSVGQKLLIPGADTKLPTPTPLPTGLPRGARLTYVVQCGDTLDAIAAKFNSTGDDIAKINNIKDALSIQIGQSLLVRVNIATATPTITATRSPAGTAVATAAATTAATGTAPATATP
jgi:LysM repeat protein